MKVFPVVHINSPEVATEQANIALSLGADGVYLIDHQSRDESILFDTVNTVIEDNPEAYIGVNILGLSPVQSLHLFKSALDSGDLQRAPDGLWADNALDEFEPGEVLTYRDSVPELKSVRYLGGIAFKYTFEFTEDAVLARFLANQHKHRVDVVTTSGQGTGKPPTVAKIRAMKEVAGTLAVASGISSDNMADYGNLIDEVLVASSVETKPYSGVFNVQALQQFIEKAHNL